MLQSGFESISNEIGYCLIIAFGQERNQYNDNDVPYIANYCDEVSP